MWNLTSEMFILLQVEVQKGHVTHLGAVLDVPNHHCERDATNATRHGDGHQRTAVANLVVEGSEDHGELFVRWTRVLSKASLACQPSQ